MPKDETKEIQKMLLELGERLGLISKKEERIHCHDAYAPFYDAVWYLDLSKYFNMDELKPLFVHNPQLLESMKRIPFAGFEVEGSTTSTKNQIGNFANLHSGHFLFNFEIVNNAAAGKENDTYRRGMKVYRYCNQIFASKNDIFMDKSHLEESIKNLPKRLDNNIHIENYNKNQRGTYGGEKAESLKMFAEILPMLQKSKLSIMQNKEPLLCSLKYETLKQSFSTNTSEYGKFYLSQNYYSDPVSFEVKNSTKAKDSFYIPKIDVEAGFNMPNGFFLWLKSLGNALKNDAVNYPIVYGITNEIITSYFISLIAIEMECSINKHLNGGICNMANFAYSGVLVTTQDASKHIDFLSQELGINNVTYYKCEELN